MKKPANPFASLLSSKKSKNRAIFVRTDVSDAASVKDLIIDNCKRVRRT